MHPKQWWSGAAVGCWYNDANQCLNVFQDGLSGIVRRTELVEAF